MLLLELIVVVGGGVEDAFQFVAAAAGLLRPLLLGVRPLLLGVRPLLLGVRPLAFGLGLLPQRVVAAEQVVEEPPERGRVIGEMQCHAHDMDYTRSFMSWE